jgi:hypothetical protein
MVLFPWLILLPMGIRQMMFEQVCGHHSGKRVTPSTFR